MAWLLIFNSFVFSFLGVNLVWQRKKDELFPAVGERGDNF
jgi:NhaP-type Na+/H+ or K+/H+ antiporter